MQGTRQSSFGLRGLAWRVALVGFISLSAQIARAQMVSKPFSADKVVTQRGKTTTDKVYATPAAMRVEGARDGKKFISISRWDRKVVWSIMPDQKMYFEMAIPAGAEMASAMNDLSKTLMKDAQMKRESLGSEQIEGFLCEKTRTTVTWQGVTGTNIQWSAKDLGGFVLKKQDDTLGQVTEFKNIRLGPQDPSLFELPPGYKKMGASGNE